MQSRLKSAVMWAGIVLSAFMALGGKPETITSWALLADAVVKIVSNPFMLGSFIYTIFAIVNNPTAPKEL